jgi:putative ABC transport system substrate-binding protein
MRRRTFIGLLGGAAVWPLSARAQQPSVRRIGVLMAAREGDPEVLLRTEAFKKRLSELGWSDNNLRVEYRWATSAPERLRQFASELLALNPEVIVAHSVTSLAAIKDVAAKMPPTVFVQGSDPVLAGFVPNLSRPGGNITGFTNFEYTIAGKWLEMLKTIAPQVTRVALLMDAQGPNWPGWVREAEAAAPRLGLQLTRAGVTKADDIEPAVASFAQERNGALLIPPNPFTAQYRDAIVALAARHRLPAIYPFRYWAAAGGLISYGNDLLEMYRRTAEYVDRILRGEKPGDLPVQAPTKFEIVINLKTARDLGLTIPSTLLAQADEVIE